jgi:polysaccharide biosynthesis/export protein
MRSSRCKSQALIRTLVLLPALAGFSFAQQTVFQAVTASPNSSADLNSTGASAPNSQKSSANPDAAIRLGPGDLLDVSIYGVPDLATKTRIGNTGDIYLPLVNYVHVGSLTLDAAQTAIEKQYVAGGFLVDPHVSVFVDEYASQGANVLGAVNRPGVYPVLGKQGLLDIIAAAGGLTERAGMTATISHKDQPDQALTVSLRGKAESTDNSAAQILPGDTIFVHKADVVYIVGDVNRPSGLMMDSGNLTVLQAIALTGGTTRTAKLNGVKIIRKGSSGMTETTVPLKKILQAKAPDVPLEANDILFVPSSAAKAAADKSMGVIVQTASALTLVAAHP